MDHLPYSNEAILPPIQIPYLCSHVEIYDGFGLKGFTQRAKWKVEGSEIEWYARDAAARAQSWLYFGLLEELLGEPFKRHLFIEKVSREQEYITSQRLPSLLKDWCYSNFRTLNPFRRPLRPEELVSKTGERLVDILTLVEEQSEILDSEVPTARLTSLSIKTLIWSFKNAIITYTPVLWTWAELRPRQSRLIKMRMLESGICPYWTEIYLTRYSSALLYCMSSLATCGSIDHENCNVEACVAYNLDKQKYTTRHVQNDCQCSMTTPDVNRIVTIIRNGDVPIMAMNTLPSGDITLEVTQTRYKLAYTAISHVWSGGLGNPSSNSLPQCQLKMIKENLMIARQSRRKVQHRTNKDYHILRQNESYKRDSAKEHFWMDTLCIPVNHGKDIRLKAIAEMDTVYVKADNVLVLDPVLQRIDPDGESKLNLRLQVLSSSWMTRCWTFQEARLSRLLAIKLRTGLYHLGTDYYYQRQREPGNKDAPSTDFWTDRKELELEALSFFEEIWPLIDARPNRKPNALRSSVSDSETDMAADLIQVWNQLIERSTSVKDDRLTILAILLDLNAHEILSLRSEERMRAVLRSRSSIPLSFLFEPQYGPVINQRKCSWIPAVPTGKLSMEYGLMKIDEEKNCYQISFSETKVSGYILAAKDSQYSRFLIDVDRPSQSDIWIRAMPDPDHAEPAGDRSVCILLYRSAGPTSSSEWLPGARFLITTIDVEKETYTIVYDCALQSTLTRPLIADSAPVLDDYVKIKAESITKPAKILLECGECMVKNQCISVPAEANATGLYRLRAMVQAPPWSTSVFRKSPRRRPPNTALHLSYRCPGLRNLDNLVLCQRENHHARWLLIETHHRSTHHPSLDFLCTMCHIRIHRAGSPFPLGHVSTVPSLDYSSQKTK